MGPSALRTSIELCGSHASRKTRNAIKAKHPSSVKAQEVGDWAGLWMRVDKGTEMVAFDSMQNRAIKGTQSWNSYDVVLDVPQDATAISFGILPSGSGEVWMNDATFEIVSSETPLTVSGPSQKTLPTAPVNLSFTE